MEGNAQRGMRVRTTSTGGCQHIAEYRGLFGIYSHVDAKYHKAALGRILQNHRASDVRALRCGRISKSDRILRRPPRRPICTIGLVATTDFMPSRAGVALLLAFGRLSS